MEVSQTPTLILKGMQDKSSKADPLHSAGAATREQPELSLTKDRYADPSTIPAADVTAANHNDPPR